jgi:hypothetical protein
VRELLPRAADEYNGRLQVTESGEILYSFPRGFTSRYRSPGAVLKRGFEKAAAFMSAALSLLFKVWIMVMLIGYFVLFMIIALASLFFAAAARTSGSNNRERNRGGGFYFGSVFNLIIRLWFYSELTRGRDGAYGRCNRYDRSGGGPRPERLYKRVFAFVFGEEDPNRDWAPREKKAVIAHIQANSGVIALPEFMAFTGLSPERAAEELLSFCGEFGGAPEAGPGGAVVYRFDELLKRGSAENAARGQNEISAPVKRLRVFSSNSRSMNRWFALINGVNLAFGGYFLYHAAATGPILNQAQLETSSYVYALVTVLLHHVTANPWPVITAGLGAVPLVFSFLFWLIPAFRFAAVKRKNREIQTGNLRRLGFLHIWSHPTGVRGGDIDSPSAECRPSRMDAARDRIIKDMGAYSMPDVEIDDKGESVYNFNALKAEKESLQSYRSGIKDEGPGKTVFDTG